MRELGFLDHSESTEPGAGEEVDDGFPGLGRVRGNCGRFVPVDVGCAGAICYGVVSHEVFDLLVEVTERG